LCPEQMAARETGFGAVEAYMHQGKLLALDLVVRLLENPLQVSLYSRRIYNRKDIQPKESQMACRQIVRRLALDLLACPNGGFAAGTLDSG